MNEGAPGVGVEFEIDAAGAFLTLSRIENAMDSATASIVADAKRIETATGSLINASGVTASFKAVGATGADALGAVGKSAAEAAREAAALAREAKRLEQEKKRLAYAGEKVVANLERQAREFGKTRSEVRDMNNELRAVEAASKGLDPLAARIRAANAEMKRLEADAAGVGQSTQKAGQGLRIIAMQMPDVIQGLLTGQKPMQVLIQQGGQVYQAGQSAGIGLRAMGSSLFALLLPFAPVIAAIGVATAGFALFNREINAGVSNKELTKGLGDTAEQAEVAEKQLKKLREETITWGDTASALFSVVGKDIKDSFVSDMKGMTSETKALLDELTTYGRMALAGLYAGVVGMKRYLAEIANNPAVVTQGADLLKRTFGKSYNEADNYLGNVGKRIRAEAIKNARARIGEEYGLPDKPDKAKRDRHAEQLEREAKAVEQSIANHYKLAAAYGVSGAEALIAEARLKAETDAIKKQGDMQAMVDRQIRLSIAERVSSSAKSTASIADQARMQKEVNDAVRAGDIEAGDAAAALRARLEDLPLLYASTAALKMKDAAAGAAASDAALDQLDKQRVARMDLTAAEKEGRLLAMQRGADDRLAEIREELRLVGAMEAVRVRSLALARAEREVKALGLSGVDAANYTKTQVSIAEGSLLLTQQQNAFNNELAYSVNLFDALDRSAVDAAGSMRNAFGEVGGSIGDAMSAMTNYFAQDERLRADRDAAIRASGNDERTIMRENRLYAIASGSAQMNALVGVAGAAKGFFKEHSRGYQAMVVAEKVLAGIQLARTAINVAAGASQMFASLGPLGFPAVAAMLGVMASLGFSGGGRGGSMPAKANDGSGSVLGNSTAQSESIKRSIDQLREVDTLTNTFAREMAASLKSIDSQIGSVAAVIVRGGDINASAGVNEGFASDATGKLLKGITTGWGVYSKIPVVGGIINGIGSLLGSLFGSSTSVIGSGLSAKSQTVGSILSSGFDAQTYSDIEKKKKFLGITTGKSYSTQYGNADPALEGQFTLLLRSFASAIGSAAGPLGEATNAVEARLNGFVVNIGKIDTKGLTGEEIAEKLTAIFGAAADGMADAAFPGIARFQQVGEGAFETLVRLASTVEAVTASLDQLGLASRALGIDAKVGIAAQFDSVSAMTSAADAYSKAFYTPAEQNAARMSQLNGVFVRLGITMPATIGAFRALVDAQDLTTAAGQSTYATLLQLAPAFADLKSAMDGAKSASDVLAEREGLQRRLLELDGNTAAIRALDLAKLDASNRALQQQIYAIEDAKAAAEAANELREAWASVGDTIADEVKRIRGLDTVGGGAGFATIMGQFNAANLSARGGDIEAAKALPGLSQALLKAAGDRATSSQELKRIQAQTAATLEATQAAIAGRSAAAATAAILANSANAAAATAPAGTAANDASAATIASLSDEVKGLRDSMEAALATIAANTGRAARVLDDVSAASGGDAISVAAAA